MENPRIVNGRFRVSASFLGTWMKCPLQAKFQYLEKLPQQQNAAASFGSCVHHALHDYNLHNDVDQAVALFVEVWSKPELIDVKPDMWFRNTNWVAYKNSGIKMVKDYHEKMQLHARKVIAAEHPFLVPMGKYDLSGIVDLVEFHKSRKGAHPELLVIDYKSGRTQTREALRYNHQFTGYYYAVGMKEFWVGNGDFPGLPDGEKLWEEHKDVAVMPMWYALKDGKELETERDEVDVMRMHRAIQEIERAIEHDVFVPNISGDSCGFCQYKRPCGLPIPATEDQRF